MNLDNSSAARRTKTLRLAVVLVLGCAILSGFAFQSAESRSYEVVNLSTRVEVAAKTLNDLGAKGYSLIAVVRSVHNDNWAFLMK
jgi:hypothetical protein